MAEACIRVGNFRERKWPRLRLNRTRHRNTKDDEQQHWISLTYFHRYFSISLTLRSQPGDCLQTKPGGETQMCRQIFLPERRATHQHVVLVTGFMALKF